MIKMGSGGRRSSRNNWLPYDVSRRLQRDAITGVALVLLSVVALLIFDSMYNGFTIRFVDGLPQTGDGAPCQLLQVFPYDNLSTPMRAMVDCGDLGGLGTAGVLQHLFLALSAVGVLLLLSAVFSLVLASRMPRETLAVPICVVAVAIGVASVWWGLQTGGPALAFQGAREVPVTGVLRVGGLVTMRDGAVSWGAGLLAAAFVRLTRP